jgi:hypothetical protein
MATFSEGFLSQLGRPAMSQSLFDLGSAIGGVPGQMKQQRKQQEFNQLMQQIQGAQGSGDFTSMKILAQQLAPSNPQEAAKVMQAATALEEKATRVSAGRDLLSGVPLQMRQGAGALADQGLLEQALEARNLAQTRQVELGEQTLAKVAGASGARISEPKNRERFFRLAKAYQVPTEKAFEIYNQFATTAGGDRTTKGEVVIRDSQGNLFTRASQYDEQGRGREVILPFPNSPEKPVGALTIVSGTTGGGFFDRSGEAGRTTVEQEFNKVRVEAVVQLPSFRRTAKNIRESIDLLESGDVTTGGFVRRMSRGLVDFLGKTPKDIGEFEARLGDIVLAKLENFPGSISNQEREYLVEQIGNYQASGESNLGRLKFLLEQAEDLMQTAITLGSAKDFYSYQQSLMQPDLSFIPEAERQEAMEAFQRGEVSVQELRGMY